MKRIGRLRYADQVLALFAAVLLVLPLADCMLVSSPGHSHAPGDPVAAFVDLVTGPDHVDSGVGEAHCEPRTEHCVKSMPPSLSGGLPHPLAPLLLLMILLPAAALLWVGAGGVRGPPAVRVLSGRMLLTRFCIARR